MSFGTRLRDRRKQLGITQPQLAEMLGASQSAVGNWEKDINSPRASLLYDIFEILQCDANYLFQDEMAELYKDTATPDEFENIIKVYRSLDESGKEAVNHTIKREQSRINEIKTRDDRIRELEDAANEDSCQYLYLHNIACAGTAFLFDDIPCDTISAPYMPGADFIIGVNGDSMEPTFYSGDKLYIERTQSIDYGEIGIFTIGNECYVKEFTPNGLKSHNPARKDIPSSNDIRVVGRVIGKVEE